MTTKFYSRNDLCSFFVFLMKFDIGCKPAVPATPSIPAEADLVYRVMTSKYNLK